MESIIDLPEFNLQVLAAIKDLSKQGDRNSRFKLNQETVAVTVFPKAKRGKSKTLPKSKLKFCVVSIDISEVFIV